MKIHAQRHDQAQQQSAPGPTSLSAKPLLVSRVAPSSLRVRHLNGSQDVPRLRRARAAGLGAGFDNGTTKERARAGNTQASASGEISAPPIVEEVLHSSSRPLDHSVRESMEARFGHDFSRVRVHTDRRAGEAATAVGARAFTVNRDIVFGTGEYAPHTRPGRWLIAHELAHTLQQAGDAAAGSVTRKKPLSVGAQEDEFEREADAAADAAVVDEAHAAGAGGLTSAPHAVQREPSSAGDTPPVPAEGDTAAEPTQAPAPPAPQLDIDFNAFIPGSLGTPFETASAPYPKDLKNQSAFEADLKAVRGTWLKEPGSFSDHNSSAWYFATDNRSFGGGSHRLGFVGGIAKANIGSFQGRGNLFSHTTSGSEHVRWKHTGTFSSKDETGSLDGPTFKSAAPKSSEEHVDTATDESTITTEGAANYPFKALSPDIDYKVVFKLKREAGGKTRLNFEITHNMFPFYELLINKGSVWTHSATDTGPSISNLSTSTTFKSGAWHF